MIAMKTAPGVVYVSPQCGHVRAPGAIGFPHTRQATMLSGIGGRPSSACNVAIIPT